MTVLDVFFRQAKESRIILNAERINKNQKKLLYGDDFQMCIRDRSCLAELREAEEKKSSLRKKKSGAESS